MNVLIAEDEPVSRRLLEASLHKWGYDVVTTCNGREALEVLRNPEAPSLVISDWMMPDMDGLGLCRKIRETETPHYVYFIILTTKGTRKDVVDGLEAGADDYLKKPFDQDELRYRIKIGERIIGLEHRILRLAATDSLTGVLNRRAFMERAQGELHRSNRQSVSLALTLADIDHFKTINDTYGHQAGDLVLKGFTDQLAKCLRPYDLLGRYGGEEFVVCLPDTNDSHASVAAERMRKEVEEMKVVLPDIPQSVQITATFGVTCSSTEFKESLDSLIKRADDAMYKAKREGRNRVCVSSHDPVLMSLRKEQRLSSKVMEEVSHGKAC